MTAPPLVVLISSLVLPRTPRAKPRAFVRVFREEAAYCARARRPYDRPIRSFAGAMLRIMAGKERDDFSRTRSPFEGSLVRIRASDSNLLLAIETMAGEFVGSVSLHGIDPRSRQAELGIWIARAHWDNGYGTDAVRVASRFGFREMNLQRLYLHVFDTNPRGIRAYEKVGFKEEGRLRRGQFMGGRYVDVIVMGLLAEDLIEE